MEVSSRFVSQSDCSVQYILVFFLELAAGKVVKTDDDKPEEQKEHNKEIKVENEPMVKPLHVGENTLWYPCDICNVKMNSMENYKDVRVFYFPY